MEIAFTSFLTLTQRQTNKPLTKIIKRFDMTLNKHFLNFSKHFLVASFLFVSIVHENRYKEYRALRLTDAIGSMYCEMAGRHRADKQSIQIIKTEEVADDQLRRAHMIQMTPHDLKFPVGRKIPVRPLKYKSTFSANRISTYRK